ncbi:RNA polymerase sigma factor [Streptomyces sp. GLT-R25]
MSGIGDPELHESQEELRRALSWEVIAGHRERLMRLVRRRLPNAQDAEDCVQEAMLRTAACGDLDRERIGHFLTSVALRLCVDNHREQERSRLLLPRTVDVRTPEIPDEGVCDRDTSGAGCSARCISCAAGSGRSCSLAPMESPLWNSPASTRSRSRLPRVRSRVVVRGSG